PIQRKARDYNLETDGNDDGPLEADYNLETDGRLQGHLDAELNEVGRQQAEAVADRLSKEYKVYAVYSSDLKRASETAQLISTYCGGLEV
ncbi:hypothetical protein IFM89_036509, partial [Coptis chinensis]